MQFDGSQIQNEIYVSGESPWPVSFADWEARAQETLEAGPFGYIAGGAGAEATMRANLEAFERRRLRPKMLTGNAVRDLSVEVLGVRSPVPFFLAPVGVLSIAHPEGELAVARAAAALGIPLVLSSAASHSMEEVAEALGDTPRWFQLYWVSDPDVAGSLVDRAAAAGYSAIVVTVDTLSLGWRPRDLEHAYLPFRQGDFVRNDYVAYLNGYAGHQSRLAILGEPTGEQQKGYNLTLEVHRKTIERCRAQQRQLSTSTS